MKSKGDIRVWKWSCDQKNLQDTNKGEITGTGTASFWLSTLYTIRFGASMVGIQLVLIIGKIRRYQRKSE